MYEFDSVLILSQIESKGIYYSSTFGEILLVIKYCYCCNSFNNVKERLFIALTTIGFLHIFSLHSSMVFTSFQLVPTNDN